MYLWTIILSERARGSIRVRTVQHLSNMMRPELQTLNVKPGTAGHPQ
jgi:hypothetical protein